MKTNAIRNGHQKSVETSAKSTGKTKHPFSFKIEGDKMAPAFLDGDVVVVEPGRKPVKGDIVLTKQKRTGKVLLGRFEPEDKDGWLCLMSDNPKYCNIPFKRADLVFVYPVTEMKRTLGKSSAGKTPELDQWLDEMGAELSDFQRGQIWLASRLTGQTHIQFMEAAMTRFLDDWKAGKTRFPCDGKATANGKGVAPIVTR